MKTRRSSFFRTILLMMLSLFIVIQTQALPKSVEQTVLEKIATIEASINNLTLSNYTITLATIAEQMIFILSYSSNLNNPLLVDTSQFKVSVLNGRNLELSSVQIKDNSSVYYPTFFQKVFNDLNKKVAVLSSQNAPTLKAEIAKLGEEFTAYAKTGKFKSEKLQSIFKIVMLDPVEEHKRFSLKIREINVKTFQYLKEGNTEKAQSEVNKLTQLFLEIENVFLHPTFQKLPTAITLFSYKDKPGQNKRHMHISDDPADIRIDEVDFNKPALFAEIKSTLYTMISKTRVNTEFNKSAQALYAKINLRISAGRSQNLFNLLNQLRHRTANSLEKALAFFEDPKNETDLAFLGNSEDSLMRKFIFPILINELLQPNSQHKQQITILLKKWINNGTIKVDWISYHLNQIASNNTIHKSEETIEQEAFLLLDLAHSENVNEKSEELYHQINEFSKTYPKILQAYLMRGRYKYSYFKKLVIELKNSSLLTENVKTNFLKQYFINPSNHTEGVNLDFIRGFNFINEVNRDFNLGLLSMGDLLDMYMLIPSNTSIDNKQRLKRLIDININKPELAHLAAQVRQALSSTDVNLIGHSLTSNLNQALVNQCSSLFSK